MHSIPCRVTPPGRRTRASSRAAAFAALGRTFDHTTLLEVSAQLEATVQDALETATAQQLIEEDPAHPGRYAWRHALTQEAIYAETVRSHPGRVLAVCIREAQRTLAYAAAGASLVASLALALAAQASGFSQDFVLVNIRKRELFLIEFCRLR